MNFWPPAILSNIQYFHFWGLNWKADFCGIAIKIRLAQCNDVTIFIFENSGCDNFDYEEYFSFRKTLLAAKKSEIDLRPPAPFNSTHIDSYIDFLDF